MAWVFMDLEMKPVDRQFRRQWDICRQEVIEFGAVKLGEDLSEIDSFRVLVKPAYGEIPPRYAKLTGITNDMVAEAADFALSWYQDTEMIYLVDGVRKAYDREYLYDMYTYLDAHRRRDLLPGGHAHRHRRGFLAGPGRGQEGGRSPHGPGAAAGL